MAQDITMWSRECRNCLLVNPHKTIIPPLQPFVAMRPFDIIGADRLEMSMSLSGMKYIVVIVDHFSKWIGAYASKDKTAKSVAHILFQRWVCEGSRWPKQIQTDKGTEFVNSVVDELAQAAGIKHTTTMGYNSRESGVTERAIGTLQRMLKKRVEYADFWGELLPNVVYAYNMTPHEATGESPIFLLHGFDPVVPSNVVPMEEVKCYNVDFDDYRTVLLHGLHIIRKEAAEHTRMYREHMKKVYDGTHKVREDLLPVVGDKVFMKLPAEKAKGKHPMLTIE